MTEFYHDGSRTLQDRFDSRRLADRLADVKVHGIITPEDAAFIERQDMFFLATADSQGQPSCSYKGGLPGFVRVFDEHTLVFPSYDGNGMFLSLGNVAINPQVGLLFIDFEQPKRLRVSGVAQEVEAGPFLHMFPGAQAVISITVTHVFPNCPRYIHRRIPAERSVYVPEAGATPPEPAWKAAEWARDVLPSKH